MAKKNATAAPAAMPEAPLKKKGTNTQPNIKIPLHQFWDYAELAWKYAEKYVDRLSARRPGLTRQYIADQVAYLGEVKQLPGKDVRTASITKKLASLSDNRKAVLLLAGLLEDAIGFAYEAQPQLIPVEVKLAGITTLRASRAGDYAAVSTFLTTAKGYLKNNGQKLLDAGAISPDFLTELETLTTEYNDAKAAYTDQSQTSKDGTVEVSDGVTKLKKAIVSVHKLGKLVFGNEPDVAKLFTADYLIEEIRSKHPAGLNGRTTWPKEPDMEKAKPVAGLLVQVVGQPDKSAVTNKEGRFEIKQLTGGEHRVRITSPTGAGERIQPVELVVVLQPGVSKRQNVTVELAPVQAPVVKEATTPPASMNEVLNKAMQDVKTSSNGESAASNGQMASQNGHAVA